MPPGPSGCAAAKAIPFKSAGLIGAKAGSANGAEVAPATAVAASGELAFAAAEQARAIPLTPTDGHVSFDWFRQSSGYVPDKVSPHDWLALCERNFIDPMPTQSGTRFVRLEGKLHVLSYRVEATSSPKLWRALPA